MDEARLTPVTTILLETDQDVGAAKHLLRILQQRHEGLLATLRKVHQPQIQSPAHHHSLPHHTGLLRHLELKAQPNAATLSSRYHFSTLSVEGQVKCGVLGAFFWGSRSV